MYLIPEDVGLNDVVVFAYHDLMQRGMQNTRKIILGDGDPLHMFDEKKGADYNVSRSNITANMTEERDGKSARDVRSVHAIDVAKIAI